ncbi:MAG: hypothetical protein Q7V53_03210 [Caldisericota bacterium]|nr:hypothetical protein [Caldisericota bacterium]
MVKQDRDVGVPYVNYGDYNELEWRSVDESMDGDGRNSCDGMNPDEKDDDARARVPSSIEAQDRSATSQ